MPSSEPIATILVVEDDTLIRMHGVDMLEENGFDVIEAADAEEALAILYEHGSVHLLFSDIDMPGDMDGLELARQVNQRWPQVKLLLTSGHHQLEEGVLPDDGQFLSKPWRQDVLIEQIRGLLAV
ncbi:MULTISPECIES: response regulator [Sphingobium]|jgi:CheY-like chemotaxis protein|uniref:Response regulator n=1 Tax=Sphingobium limneticum TaxID=1007511 RepID=A0A5J5I2W4_9SPHN|nr:MULTISPECIES: response regulator [Sphingobium]KAA9014925.1 response regulator [Sphingobium limneticum]KAA9017380.1 response regulator [Sphingobium limneticum]KAA9027850.1 response regulator [Sphingobium limneticum]BBD01098.1 hypothetical protein YGS_C1P2353 [Sphingobium sp. YG1]